MISRELLVPKIKAFGIHFGISFAIFLILLYFVLVHWYPVPFFRTDGGWQGIRLIVFVDLVLGPTLTFIVFNPQKPRHLLKMDLSLIALCQVAALTWGIWAVHNERPYLMVFADGTFYPLAYYQLDETGLTKQEIEKLGNGSPPMKIYTEVPEDQREYFALLRKAVASQPIHFMGDRYRRFNQERLKEISRYSIDMDAYLKGEAEDWHRKYADFARRHQDKLDDMLFFAFNGRYGKYILAMDRNTLEFVEVLDIPPPGIDEIIWGKKEAKRRAQRRKEKQKQSK